MTSGPTLAERLAERHQAAAAALPADVIAVFDADREELIAAGVPARVVSPGTALPDADLLDVHGAAATLAAARAGRPAVLVFYRGGWCPYCNLTLRAYQQELVPALAERRVALIAVSPQRPDGSLSTQEANDLTFTVLSDPGGALAAALGILADQPEGTVAAQAKLGLDVAEANADGSRALPMPTVVVVDAAGVIRWIDVHPDYTTRSEVGQILAAVDAVTGSGEASWRANALIPGPTRR
jgi:peroxiredoxin